MSQMTAMRAREVAVYLREAPRPHPEWVTRTAAALLDEYAVLSDVCGDHIGTDGTSLQWKREDGRSRERYALLCLLNYSRNGPGIKYDEISSWIDAHYPGASRLTPDGKVMLRDEQAK